MEQITVSCRQAFGAHLVCVCCAGKRTTNKSHVDPTEQSSVRGKNVRTKKAWTKHAAWYLQSNGQIPIHCLAKEAIIVNIIGWLYHCVVFFFRVIVSLCCMFFLLMMMNDKTTKAFTSLADMELWAKKCFGLLSTSQNIFHERADEKRHVKPTCRFGRLIASVGVIRNAMWNEPAVAVDLQLPLGWHDRKETHTRSGWF